MTVGMMAIALTAESAKLPIMGWDGIPFDKVSVEGYLQAKDAGFTHMMQGAPDLMGLKKVLDCAEKAGIMLSIHSPVLMQQEAAEIVRKIKNHPALALYQLRDEPHVRDMHMIGIAAKRIMEEDSVHPCYVNWFGVVTTNPMKWYGVPDFRSYVAESRKQIPIKLISFDKYPLIVDGRSRPPLPFRDLVDTMLKTNWFETLEIIRDVSQTEKVPFWAFSIATAHRIGISHCYPTATVAGMKLQQYANLAYGAQGLQYYTYWPPHYNEGMRFHDAPMTNEGKMTFVMDRVREVNKELQARGFVFVGSEVKWVRHTGEEIPVAAHRLEKKDLPPSVRNLEVEAGAIVSCITNGGVEYLMIVSRELHKSFMVKAEFTPGTKRVRTDGSLTPVEWYDGEFRLTPGDAEIFRLGN